MQLSALDFVLLGELKCPNITAPYTLVVFPLATLSHIQIRNILHLSVQMFLCLYGIDCLPRVPFLISLMNLFQDSSLAHRMIALAEFL